MKHTKRLSTWILAVVLIVASAVLVACVDKPQAKQLTELTLPELNDNQMAVIIKNGDEDYTSYTVTLTDELKTGEDVINYLADKADLDVVWQDGEFGKYLTELGGIRQDESAGKYIIIFTNVTSDQGTYAGVTTYNVDGVALVESGKGISSMTVQPGAVIYFEIVTY